MDFKLHQHKLMQLSSRFNLMVLIVIGLLISNVIMSCVVWVSAHNQRIEVTPFFSGGNYAKSRNKVDASYLRQMSENFIYSRLNVTPESVKENHKRLLKFVDSRQYVTFTGQLEHEAALIIKQKISSHFEIIDIKVDAHSLQCRVKGILKRSVGLRDLPDAPMQYMLSYHYNLDRLTLVNFSKESKDEAH